MRRYIAGGQLKGRRPDQAKVTLAALEEDRINASGTLQFTDLTVTRGPAR